MMPYFVTFLLLILANSVVYSQARRPDSHTKTLIQIPDISQHDIDTCTVVADYSTYVTSLLDSCTFTTATGATHFATCHKQCVAEETCVALTSSSTNVCEHCIKTTGSGNGNSYTQDDVMVVIEALNDRINGELSSSIMSTHLQYKMLLMGWFSLANKECYEL